MAWLSVNEMNVRRQGNIIRLAASFVSERVMEGRADSTCQTVGLFKSMQMSPCTDSGTK